MQIRKDDYQDILEYLVSKREEGQEFVAFFNSAPVHKDELFTFCDQYEAQEFCYEMTTDVDTYSYLSIRSAYRTIAEALNDNKLLIEKEGIVDVGLMVLKRYERLETEQLNNNQNSKIMNQKNFDYLKDQVKFTGFGDSLQNELKQKMEEQLPEFKLLHIRKFDKDEVAAVLNFKKPENSNVYFFNSYDLSVKQDSDKQELKQTFYVGRENNFTLKEGYNLLAGRAVHKELARLEKVGDGEQVQYKPTDEKYNAWVQLDFKNTETNGNFKMKYFHENYGFDISSELQKHPIKELANSEDHKKLLQSLEKGNRQSVTFIIGEQEQKRFIQANPQYKSIAIYDLNQKRIRQSKKQDDEGGQKVVKQESKQEKQEASPDEEGAPVKGNKKRRERKHGISG